MGTICAFLGNVNSTTKNRKGVVDNMSFSSMLEILQAANKEKIVLIRLGAFYIATGRDAILLHRKLQLKVTCFKNNM